MDVRSSFIQMQGPIQNVNVLAKTLMELVHKFCGDLKKLFRGSVAFQCSKLINAFFGTGFLAGKQIFGGAVSFCVPDFGVALILSFGEVGVMEFVVELFDFFNELSQLFDTYKMVMRIVNPNSMLKEMGIPTVESLTAEQER